MIKIFPFKSVLPKPENVHQIACEPYDVVSTEEARQAAASNPISFLHVVRPEIDFEQGQDIYAAKVYDQGFKNFESLIADGHMCDDDENSIFIYRQVFHGREQFGVVCCYDVQQYRDGTIKKHEKTRPDKEDDRTRHLTTCSAHTEPVFLCFKDEPQIAKLIESDCQQQPLFDFAADDGVTHTVWRAASPESYVRAFEDLDRIYIADGHHRTAAGARAATQRQADNEHHSGQEEYNRVLAVIFPASQLQILAYNRVVKDLNGLSLVEFEERLSQIGKVTRTGDMVPEKAGSLCIYVAGNWLQFEFPTDLISQSDPIESLDVSLLQNRILSEILGVGDPRTDSRLQFVGGIRGTKELKRLVDTGKAAIAFSMYPTSIEQLIDVSDSGKIMPPKSTWFEPKLKSGLFVHRFEK